MSANISTTAARDTLGRFSSRTHGDPEAELRADPPEWFGRVTPEDVIEMAAAADG